MKYYLIPFLISCFPLAVATTALAIESEAQKYQKCMSLVQSSNPEKVSEGVNYAIDWIFGGNGGISGGVPAEHCKALGFMAQGKNEEAAKLLEKLADDMIISTSNDPRMKSRNVALRADLYSQAALAWKATENLDNSYIAFSSALSILSTDRGDPSSDLSYELYLERGTLQILRRQYKAAVEDLTFAIERNDQLFEGYLQRAKAHRKRRHFLKARLDIRVAATLSENHPAILLESGILFREEGKKMEAKAVWQKIVEMFPQSDIARLAHENIALLKVEGPQ